MVKLDDLRNELVELEAWFKNYDIQVNQYLRDIRLQETSSIDIEALDSQALVKKERIKVLRSEIIKYWNNI